MDNPIQRRRDLFPEAKPRLRYRGELGNYDVFLLRKEDHQALPMMCLKELYKLMGSPKQTCKGYLFYVHITY